MMLLQSIILTLTTHCIYAMAQLTFQTDTYRNTFTLKTPSLQQTFTRYYGGQQQVNGILTDGRLQQQQPLNNIPQEQPHQFAPFQQTSAYTIPQNFLTNKVQHPQQYYQENQLAIPQRNEYHSQNLLQQQQQPYLQQQIYQPTEQQLQQQNYFQQLQSVQPLLFASRQQTEQQQAANAAATPSQLDGFSSTAITTPEQSPQENNNLLGVAFSASDQVSQVKFSNGNECYICCYTAKYVRESSVLFIFLH